MWKIDETLDQLWCSMWEIASIQSWISTLNRIDRSIYLNSESNSAQKRYLNLIGVEKIP